MLADRTFVASTLALVAALALPPGASAAPAAAAGKAEKPGNAPADAKGAKGAKLGKGKAGPKVKVDPAIEQAQKLLDSGDRAQVESGIQSLGLIGKKEVVAPLAERLRRGLPPELMETAILTLMTLGEPSAGPVLNELAAHRRPEVRLRAIEAITALRPPGAEATLVAALSDGDDGVRSAAASGLGELGARDAFEVLFHALDRGNMAASQALGKVVEPGQATRLLGYLGRIPFYSLGPALGEVLKRTDVAEPAKLQIIAGLQEVATPEVKGFLGDVMGSAGDALGANVKRAIMHAMQEIAD